eukprot:148387-Heterocapsa_arctica.AAC.1
MAEELTMREVKILEGKQEKKGPTLGVLKAEPSVENMQMVIAHSGITQSRTCMRAVNGKIAKEEDIGEDCERKSCLKCLARCNTSGFKSSITTCAT